MTELVLDKSFLDGASHQLVSEACVAHRALCTESLFFGLMTIKPESQGRCFAKLPDRPHSFVLIPNVGTLLRFEVENRKPCVPLFDRRIEGAYVFNPKLRDRTYVPKGEVLETLNTWRAKSPKTRSPSCSAVSSCISFFRNSLALIRDFPGAVFAARRTVATDEGLVRNIYASFLDENASSNALQPAVLDPQWAWFRWVQCQLLAALRIFQRYQYRIPDPPTPNVLLKAEHSMHDLGYVLLASLAGGIATNDTEVEKDFRLVHPDGRVLSFRSK